MQLSALKILRHKKPPPILPLKLQLFPMEKKEPISSNPRGVCEKLFDAISVSPGFRQFRRISYPSQDPASPATPPKSPAPLPPSSVDRVPKINPVQTEKPEPGKGKHVPDKSASGKNVVAEHVQVKGDPQPLLPLPSNTPELKEKPLAPTPASDSAPVKSKKVDTDPPMKTLVHKGRGSRKVHQLEGKKEEKKTMKLEAPDVTKGEGEKKGGLANINEKANDYIARARMKIRHTATTAGGDSNARTSSFK